MTLKNVILAASILATSAFAFAAEVEANAEPFHGGGQYRMWQCSAHNSHSDWQIYYGEPSPYRQVANQTAVHECEHHEAHQCVPHECFIVSGN